MKQARKKPPKEVRQRPPEPEWVTEGELDHVNGDFRPLVEAMADLLPDVVEKERAAAAGTPPPETDERGEK